MALNPDNSSEIWGFDPKGRMIYGHSLGIPLITFSSSGAKLAEAIPRGVLDDPKQFLVHPSGKKLVLLTKKKLYWVQIL